MQRPDPAPDHGSLRKHMALASSRQHGTQPKYVSQHVSPLLAPALPYGAA